ncbi:putative ribonuclease H-like domain-containing protein [Tanacetum coccineum]
MILVGIDNLIDLRVKVIRYDNETEFKNRAMNQLCEMNGIKREFSVARTPQQNGVAERKNRTLIEVARTIKLALSFMRPFGCLVTILNTIDHLGKFDGKADEGFFVGYSTNSKAFRVFNSRTRIVEENLHVQFSENTPNIAGSEPNWLFDIDALTNSINYKPVVVGNQSNGNAGTKACADAGKARVETVPRKSYILLPLWTQDLPFSSSPKDSLDARFKPQGRKEENKDAEEPEMKVDNAVDENIVYGCADDPNIPDLEKISRFSDAENNDSGVDINNLDTYFQVSPVPTIRIHKDHPLNQVIGDLQLATQTRQMTKNLEEYGFVVQALKDPSWIKAMQDELLQFKLQQIEDEVYVCQPPDDIIFGSTKKKLCTEFEKMMHKKFQMSSMGKLTFFLGLQVKQKEDGIFISQDKYVTEILKKFGFSDVKTASTPMETHKPLLKDADGEDIDEHMYRSMIGSLMYLTSSRPNIIYLKGKPKLSLWYRKDLPFDLVAYTDSDYVGASLDRKSTTRGCQFLRCRLISWQCKKQTVVAISITEAEYIAVSILVYCLHAKTVNGEVQLQVLVDGKKIVVTEASVRRDLQLEDANGVDCLPNAIIFEQLTLIGYEKLSHKLTFYKAFFSPQWKFLIHTILQCLSAKTTAWNEFSSTMASTIICLANNQKFNFSKYIFESMMKNLDSAVKFLMYPRFVQVFLDNQLEGMINHNRIYIAPSHTKKVFANMKRQGKDFSDRVTPLFSTMMVQAQQEQGKGLDMPTITQPSSSQPQKKHKPRKPKKKDIQIPQSNVPSNNLANEVVNEENVSKHSNDPLLSGEDRLKLEELMALCTNLQNRVLDLEHTKTTQALEIDSLKRRVKKLKKKQRSRTHGLRRLYKVGLSARVVSSEDEGLGEEDASKQGRKIHDIDADEDITLENVHDEDMFDTGVFNDEEVFAGQDMAEKEVSTADPVTTAGEVVTTANVEVSTASPTAATITTVELTLAQTLAELKSARPKTKGVVMQEPSETTTTTTTIPSKDKGKGIMVEEPLKMKKKDQVLFDEQEAIRLQAQFDKEERIAREKEEANAALIAQWNDIQDKVETDYELAQRLQAEEQEELTIKEKSKLFQQLLEKRKKHFAAKRAEERRNRPPTKAQQRSIMCTYLKNMVGWKPKDLKTKSFANVQELFDKEMKRVKTFVDMDTELVGDSEVRAESNKKVEAEVDDAKEAEELKKCLEILPDDGDDVTIDAIPLSVKIPIVDYKIYQEGKKSFFKIIKADRKTQMLYLTRRSLEVLRKFHWMILGGRFNQLSHVSSPLLSKPGEY